MSIKAIGMLKCDVCQANTVAVGDVVVGTHGNLKVNWRLPEGWVSGGIAVMSHKCMACAGGKPIAKSPTNVNVLAHMISVLRSEASSEDMVEALRALLAVET